ncbi:hypothetical protein [Roseixanthobacter pseudopolyaromaticivorans]|uniref:hypothetical protein n=1 Tax=Xanthobacteraceae TaxID=335928 RepID=UPI00372BBB99
MSARARGWPYSRHAARHIRSGKHPRDAPGAGELWMGTTRAKESRSKGRDAFFQRVKFLTALLGFLSAPAAIGMALRLLGHLTLRSSLVWAILAYPVIIVIAAIVGVSMLFSSPSAELSGEGTQVATLESDADRQQDPFAG